jgi:hypothetical protein
MCQTSHLACEAGCDKRLNKILLLLKQKEKKGIVLSY